MPQQPGIYHKVRSGQTLWRIAKVYNISIDDIVRSNRIPDVAHIEQGQFIFIPGADSQEIIGDSQDLGEFDWPVKGSILSYFGQRQIAGSINNGIDIRALPGETVKASRDGRVMFADYLIGYAQTIILDHQDGYFTVYSQNAELLANLDDFIVKGEPLARIDSQSALPFVHFEVRKEDIADNPLYYLP